MNASTKTAYYKLVPVSSAERQALAALAKAQAGCPETFIDEPGKVTYVRRLPLALAERCEHFVADPHTPGLVYLCAPHELDGLCQYPQHRRTVGVYTLNQSSSALACAMNPQDSRAACFAPKRLAQRAGQGGSVFTRITRSPSATAVRKNSRVASCAPKNLREPSPRLAVCVQGGVAESSVALRCLGSWPLAPSTSPAERGSPEMAGIAPVSAAWVTAQSRSAQGSEHTRPGCTPKRAPASCARRSTERVAFEPTRCVERHYHRVCS